MKNNPLISSNKQLISRLKKGDTLTFMSSSSRLNCFPLYVSIKYMANKPVSLEEIFSLKETYAGDQSIKLNILLLLKFTSFKSGLHNLVAFIGSSFELQIR
jgi:hypothetical protein